MDDLLTSPSPRKILIVRLSALGDVVQTLPVIGFLRDAYPEAEIGWLVEADAAVLLQGNPALDFVHVSHRKRWNRLAKNPLNWPSVIAEVGAFFAELRHAGYDMALDFQGLLKSSLTLAMTGIPKRVGFQAAREGAPLFYTHQVPLKTSFFDWTVPIVQHFYALAASVGAKKAELSYPLPDFVSALPKEAVFEKPYLVFAPATQWKSKHWPVSSWRALLQLVLTKTAYHVVLVGGAKEIALADEILSSAGIVATDRVYNAFGKTSLPELAVILSHASVVIGPDSAPLHLAGAIGHAKLIGLYGPTAYRRTPPPMAHPVVKLLSTEGQLVCQPCDSTTCMIGTLDCLTKITPEQVFETLLALETANS